MLFALLPTFIIFVVKFRSRMIDALLHIELPVTDPTWIFFIVLCIILFAPIIFGRLNIPHIIGMILAGVLIGEHGLNILDRDSSFALFGNVGLYYIMFLAGLEMNMENFKSIRVKAVVFGLLGFIIPMALGYAANVWVLGYAVAPALLMAAMYASHTLVSYPIVTRYGVTRHRSVSVAVGATAITDSLTLFVLAIVGGQFKDDGQNPLSLLWLVARVAVLATLIIYFFPRIGRWFFRKYSNGVVQFIFVLALVFLSAGLMKFVGMEGILGAFLAGLVLNRLIPHVSPLMHNLEFVGNALFVPYFLIGVGMLIDIKVFFGSITALEVAGVMIAMSLLSKWFAAWATQKVCRMSSGERDMLFGLSTARAAATLAVVMVGYSIVLPDGLRLLGDEVLNGAIALILVTCIVSSFVTERASRRIALDENALQGEIKDEEDEKILISVSNPDTVEHLVTLSLLIRNPKNVDNIIALNVINDSVASPAKTRAGKRLLANAVQLANSAGASLKPINRYGLNVASDEVMNYTYYKDAMKPIVERLKTAFPEASVLIVGVGDRENKDENGELRTMPGVKRLIRYQQALAAETGVAFWNMFEAMGGEGSMVEMVNHKPQMANYDYTHINFRGGKHIAGLLFETLMYGKEQYEKRKAYEME